MAKFNLGDVAFIVESNRTIREVTVGMYGGGLYLVKFKGGGGIKVKEHRLFATEDEAKASIHMKEPEKKYRSPYDF